LSAQALTDRPPGGPGADEPPRPEHTKISASLVREADVVDTAELGQGSDMVGRL
jgi:hypothetical protein